MPVLFVFISQLYQKWCCYCLEHNVLFVSLGEDFLLKNILVLFQKCFTCTSEKNKIITNNDSSNISFRSLHIVDVFFWSSTSLTHFIFFFYPQSCPPPCRWTATWRNRSTCGRITRPTSWQRRPSILQWQQSHHTVLSVYSSVPTQRYSHTLQLKHICVCEGVMVVKIRCNSSAG